VAASVYASVPVGDRKNYREPPATAACGMAYVNINGGSGIKINRRVNQHVPFSPDLLTVAFLRAVPV